MKLSFTTLACPDWEVSTVIAKAAAFGFDGIDFRGIKEVMNVYELPAFAERHEQTRSLLRDAGVAVSCFSSSIELATVGRAQLNMEELKRYIELCERFDAPYIRAFGGWSGGSDRSAAAAAAAAQMDAMEPLLREAGVRLLIETHGAWTACDDVAILLAERDPPTFGVLWDIHHPFRTNGERPERTWSVLGRWIAYTHWKDSRGEPSGGGRYCLMGEGDAPLDEAHAVLNAGGYDGWHTLEWEKRWHPELAEPEIALPQYVRFMKHLQKKHELHNQS